MLAFFKGVSSFNHAINQSFLKSFHDIKSSPVDNSALHSQQLWIQNWADKSGERRWSRSFQRGAESNIMWSETKKLGSLKSKERLYSLLNEGAFM